VPSPSGWRLRGELGLTGILVVSTIRGMPILTLMPIVIQEELFLISSAIEESMVIDWLFHARRAGRGCNNSKNRAL
jgi:hypothetical protein